MIAHKLPVRLGLKVTTCFRRLKLIQNKGKTIQLAYKFSRPVQDAHLKVKFAYRTKYCRSLHRD